MPETVLHVAGLILARGGSQGIPLKNITPLSNHPLLVWSLGAMKAFGRFDSVWVSTDHPLIAQCASSMGASVFHRSPKFAKCGTPSVDAVQEFLSVHPEVDIVGLVQCTSPFLQPEFLNRAYELVIERGYDSVFSVSRDKKLRWSETDFNEDDEEDTTDEEIFDPNLLIQPSNPLNSEIGLNKGNNWIQNGCSISNTKGLAAENCDKSSSSFGLKSHQDNHLTSSPISISSRSEATKIGIKKDLKEDDVETIEDTILTTTIEAKNDRNGDLGKVINVTKTNSDDQVLFQVIELTNPLMMEQPISAIKDIKDNNSDSFSNNKNDNNGCYDNIVDSYKSSSIKSDNSQSKDNKTISVMETTTRKNGSSSRSQLETKSCSSSTTTTTMRMEKNEKKKKNTRALNFDPSKRPRRQDWKGDLVENGMLYFATRHLIQNHQMLQGGKCTYVEVPTNLSIEIDSSLDLAHAEQTVIHEGLIPFFA